VLFSLQFKEVQSLKSNAKVNDVKFSPDGNMLAVGVRDGSIDVYMKEESFKKIGSCKVGGNDF
jgi:WD40 repeat protein